VCPDASFSPNKRIQLGQLIRDPRYPYVRLAPPIKVDKLPGLQEDEETHGGSFSSLVSKSVDGDIRATIQSFLTLGFSVRKAQKAQRKYIFDKESITEFEPAGSYFDETMKQRELQSVIHRRKVIYMVVAVRVAHGATVTLEKGKGKGFKAAADVPLIPGGNQVGGNMALAVDSQMEFRQVQERDFVWAFRLKRCVPPLFRGIYKLDPIYVRSPDMLGDSPDLPASTQSGIVPKEVF
jgi:hypothetical protein